MSAAIVLGASFAREKRNVEVLTPAMKAATATFWSRSLIRSQKCVPQVDGSRSSIARKYEVDPTRNVLDKVDRTNSNSSLTTTQSHECFEKKRKIKDVWLMLEKFT